MFIDEATIRVQGGDGGNGCVSFRREKYVPFGGPNGGNGGRGGHVILKASFDKSSLLDFKYQPKYVGERGEHGMGKDMYGRGGEDVTLLLPPGTLVFDNETQLLLVDLAHDGDEFVIAHGGKGGRGNMNFATSTNRAPKTATPGEAGEKREVRLELRLLADVGLVGLPNAGKSSLLRSVSRATPKVANYPFTTLEPGLGVVSHKDQQIVLADLPGLIEGASQGLGLGHRFLRHVSRNRLLLHLVDCSMETLEIVEAVRTIRKELAAYDTELTERPQVLVFTKADLMDAQTLADKKRALELNGLSGFFISSHTRYGLEGLLDFLAEKRAQWSIPPPAPTPEPEIETEPSDAGDLRRHV